MSGEDVREREEEEEEEEAEETGKEMATPPHSEAKGHCCQFLNRPKP